MSTAELRQKLIGKISTTDDEALLFEVYRLLQISEGDVNLYPLTSEQISVVNESMEEVKNGKFLTDDEANKDMDEWLGK